MLTDTDCLVLSIFTPSDEVKDASVLFHIHDGNFLKGSGDFEIYHPDQLVQKGIILVLPNYRLGPLGFLCLRDEVAPGNAALKDLTLALKWVKDNIEKFGGNPEEITVSAGGTAGALVSLLAISPMSNTLFRRAIIESGSALAPWALDRQPVSKAMQLVNALSVKTKSNANTKILLEQDIETILETALEKHLIFKPCVDEVKKPFLKYTPLFILETNKFNKNITFMIGSANKAGMFDALNHTVESLAKLNQNYELLLPNDLHFRNNNTARCNAANDIKKMYFADAIINGDEYNNLALYYTDVNYLNPILRSARLLTEGERTVYLYEFSYDGGLNSEKLILDEPLEGATRGDMIGYLFVNENDKKELTPDDADMVEVMTDFWISFISNG